MRLVRTSDKMIFRSLLVVWLFVDVLVNGQTTTQEVTRKLCPPMKDVPPPQNRVDTSDRVKRLREEMTKVRTIQGPPLEAYLITQFDEHMNDFTADNDKRLEFISGYSGNYGLAIVTKNKSALWTDELHHFQANNELSCDWILYKTDNMMTAAAEWLIQELPIGQRIGADPKYVPNTEWEIIGRSVSSSKSLVLVPIAQNLIDVIWPENERAATPVPPAYFLGKENSGKEWIEKVNSLRNVMKNLEVDAMVVTALSEVAWLLNIRGFDLPYAPFIKAYLIVTKDQIHLYTAQNKLTDVKAHLATESCATANCVRVHDYDAVWNDLRKLSQTWKKVILPSMSHFSPGVSRGIQLTVSLEKRRMIPSPLIDMIAEKNEAEKEGMRKTQVTDAMIFCNIMARIADELERSPGTVDELRVVNITNQLRLDDAGTRSISYPTSVSSGPHTGMPLYVPNNFTNIMLEENALLIIDSGAHYWSGTSALARTFMMDKAEITLEHIERYTRLLMGLINLASFTFPSHLYTSQLDIIARLPLWEVGIDFPHGSGHGIGVFLDFYESPIDLNYRNLLNDTLKEGYFLLVEVGYYQEDVYGMKLSMILEVVRENFSSGSYLTFKPATLVPFETNMINVTMLSLQQKIWLNEYNKRIGKEVIEELKRLTWNNAYNWVLDRVEPIKLSDEEDNAGQIVKSKLYFVIVVLIFDVIFLKQSSF